MKAQEQIRTSRLLLRRPNLADAARVFERYANDPEVTRYLGWPRHQTLSEAEQFLVWSDADWAKWPAGPYLILSPDERQLLGGTGLSFESPNVVSTGYVLARDAWGFGYATEALRAMVTLARDLSIPILYALCHPDNAASVRVLEKCGFAKSQNSGRAPFPNLGSTEFRPCLVYSRI